MESPTQLYKNINGLTMYYELHGEGEPLVLLHGQFAGASMFSSILPGLVKKYRVILPEQQGHAHTADIKGRPFSFAQMADDTAELLRQLNINSAIIFGYSGGASVAMQLALRHPKLVNKLILASGAYDISGYAPEIVAGLKHPSPDAFPPIVREEYEAVAPQPENWPTLVTKMSEMITKPNPQDTITLAQLETITAPSYVIMGDQDLVLPEHAKAMAKALKTEVVTVPGDHVSYISFQTEPFEAKLHEFLA